MQPHEVLKLIKTIRDMVNDLPNTGSWANNVCDHLDKASDIIEFPKPNSGLVLDGNHNVTQV